MDRRTVFICHTKEQKQAVCEVLKQRGDPVSPHSLDGNINLPVMMWGDYDRWVGHARHADYVRRAIEQGYKVIDLNESSTRGGY